MDTIDNDDLDLNLNVLEEQDNEGLAPDVSHLLTGFDSGELQGLFCDASVTEDVFDTPMVNTDMTDLSVPHRASPVSFSESSRIPSMMHHPSISHVQTPSKIGSSSYTKLSGNGLHLLYLTSPGSAPKQIPDSPEDQAELIASNATIALRQSGLAFMEQESGTINTIDEFRNAFYGSEGVGMDISMNSDDEGGYGNDSDNETGSKKKRKKGKRPHNPDSELIEAATEEQLLVLKIDPVGKEGKRQRRRIRNRMSAQLHRERKKLYIDALEAFVKIKDVKIRRLESDVAKLAQENRSLKSQQAHVLLPTALSGDHVEREVEGISVTTGSVSGSITDTTDIRSEISMSPAHTGLTDADVENGDGDSANQALITATTLPSRTGTSTSTRKRSRSTSKTGTSNSNSTGILVAKSFGSVLPLLSVICVLCLTYYQSGGLQTLQFLSQSSLSSIDSASDSMSTMDLNDNSNHRVLLELPLPTISNNANEYGNEKALTPTKSRDAQPLHSHSLNSISTAFDQHHVYTAHYRHAHNGGYDPSVGNRALWSYPNEHMLMTLYPRYREVMLRTGSNTSTHSAHSTHSTAFGATEGVNGTWSEPPVVRRHLRVRSHGSSNTGSSKTGSSSISSKAVVSHSTVEANPNPNPTEKSLVPAASAALHGHSQGNGIVPIHSIPTHTPPVHHGHNVAVSRVLMGGGRALLDPKMTEMITLQAKSSSSSSSSSSSGNSSDSSSSNGGGKDSKSHSYSPHYAIDMGPASSSYSTGTNANNNVISSDNNVLFMLVPASSVRWGSNWEDSHASTTASLLQSLQHNQNETVSGGNSDGNDGEMYIELGCSIFKAQLVRDVEALQGKMS